MLTIVAARAVTHDVLTAHSLCDLHQKRLAVVRRDADQRVDDAAVAVLQPVLAQQRDRLGYQRL